MGAKLDWVRRLLLHNKGLKLLSLLMAALSWLMIRDAISLEVVIPDIRLQIRAQEGMAILNQSASSVDVTVRGSQEDIQRLDPHRIQAIVELSSAGAALSTEIEITPGMVHGVRGARAVAVHPTRIHVALDHQDEKRLPVRVRTTGSPLLGTVESATPDPATVLLRGPAARLRTTDYVYTQPVDVDGRVESFLHRTALQAPGLLRIEPAGGDAVIDAALLVVEAAAHLIDARARAEEGEPGASAVWHGEGAHHGGNGNGEKRFHGL